MREAASSLGSASFDVSVVASDKLMIWDHHSKCLCIFVYFLCRLLGEESSGGPTERGAGGGVGPGRALHSAVRQTPGEVQGADGQRLLHPGPS